MFGFSINYHIIHWAKKKLVGHSAVQRMPKNSDRERVVKRQKEQMFLTPYQSCYTGLSFSVNISILTLSVFKKWFLDRERVEKQLVYYIVLQR